MQIHTQMDVYMQAKTEIYEEQTKMWKKQGRCSADEPLNHSTIIWNGSGIGTK